MPMAPKMHIVYQSINKALNIWGVDRRLFFLALLMCVSAAVVSINKVTHLDPAMVFKG